MKKISTVIAILAVILIVFSVNTSGQSLKSRTWQSQDSTGVRLRPSTLVLNPDGTYYQLEYHFNDVMKLSNIGGFEEGTYTDTQTTLTLTQYVGEDHYPPVTYKITWLNSSEFILPVGINKYHFAELGSDGDVFTPKYLIPYIKEELRFKHKVNPCYQGLVDQINAANDRLKEEAVNNSKLIRKSSLVGTIWQMQMGKNKEERGRLNNISFGDDGVMREITFNYADGSITGTDREKKSAYREEAGEILVFNENGTVSLPLQIKWESEDQLIIGKYYYARFNSDKDLFSKDYIKNYVRTLLEGASVVYPAFLEVFAENRRRVEGKIYKYVGDSIPEVPYWSFEFSTGIQCKAYANKFFSMQLKSYRCSSTSLSFSKRSLLELDENKHRPWDEIWDFKWLNSQEFLLIKDGKSYHYVFQGVIPPKTYE